MGKHKKKPKTDTEKELLEKQLLRTQIVESVSNTIFTTVSIAIAIATAIVAISK